MQWQGDLWGHVDEALTQQQPHRLAGVIEDLLQLFCHTVCRVLLTLIHNQLLHLLHTLHTLPTASDTHTLHTHTLNISITCVHSFIIRASSSQLVYIVGVCYWCYLSLSKVEHSDEAKHFIRVIIITVFWHLSLLKQRQGTHENMLEQKLQKSQL